MDENLTAVIQARMKSKRLPGKVLMPVLNKPLLLLNIERILLTKKIGQVIVATSDTIEDDLIQKCCIENNIPIFRGSEEDVLDRLYQCACEYSLNPLVRFTADNPLVDPGIIDKVVNYYFQYKNEFDYVSNNHPPSYPDGLEVEVISRHALEAAWRESKKTFQREHATPFIWDNPERFRIGNVASDSSDLYKKHRWTLDFSEDFKFVEAVFENLYPDNPSFSMFDILDLLTIKPELQELNAMHAGINWYSQNRTELKTVRTT